MGYWGWRPLIMCLFVSVLILGCTPAHETLPSSTPTEHPRITLQVRRLSTPTAPSRVAVAASPTPPPPQTPTAVVYIAQAGDTLLNIAARFGIRLEALRAANNDINPQNLQIGQELRIPNPPNTADGLPILRTPTPPPLALPLPHCYETFSNRLLCLGLVENTLRAALERVVVRVQLYDWSGALIGTQDTVIEQRFIRPGESAPYRVLFAQERAGDVYAAAYLVRADHAAESAAHLLDVRIRDESMDQLGGQYILSATLYNPGPQPADQLWMVVTLKDEQGALVGYRVLQSSEPLAPGEERAVRISVMPYADRASLSHSLYVEARPRS